MKFIISTAAAALLTTTAFAADAVYSYEPVPTAVAQVPAYAWTGAYVGINAGYGSGKDRLTYLDSGFSGSLTGGGFVGGVQAGYNWQSGSFVYGVETDIQYSGIEADESWEADSWGAKVEWFGTTRARLGFTATERMMAYATGGIAYGRYEAYDNTLDSSEKETRTGWTAGAGVEYAIDDNWTLKTEYLYTDLGKWSWSEPDFDLEGDFRFHTVRAGVNFKF